MSQYYAEIEGARKPKTCTGTKNSGMFGHLRGWDIGARVFVNYNDKLDCDQVNVLITSGSNDRLPSRHLGTFVLNKKRTGYKKIA